MRSSEKIEIQQSVRALREQNSLLKTPPTKLKQISSHNKNLLVSMLFF